MKKKIIFIVPAHNEEQSLKKVICSLKKYGEVITINDNSNDKTGFIANKYSNYVINNKKKLGYDCSVRIGIKFALKKLKKKEIIFTFDGDGQHLAYEVPKFLNKIKNNDVVLGRRNYFNRYSESIVSFLSIILDNINDPLTGFKCYKKSYLIEVFKILKNKNYLGMFFLKKIKKIDQVKINIVKKSKSRIGWGIKVNYEILLTYICIKLNLI